MSKQCWIGTRKGLIKAEQSSDNSWSLSPPIFPGEPVSIVLPDNGSGAMFAALNLGHFGPKLHRSVDGGQSWQECNPPSFPKSETGEGKSVELIWIMEFGADNALLAGTVPAGLFRSMDQGDSWEFLSSLNESPGSEEWFGGGFDEPGIHSIHVDPRDANKLTIAIFCGGVWYSEDNGVSWTNKAHGMRAEYVPPEQQGNVNTQDPHRLLACPADPDRLWVQHHNGIFRFDESDGIWQEIHDVNPSNFGFALAVHPHDKDTAWFVPAVKDERRIPVDLKLVVNRTRDGGKSFEALDKGLPQNHSYDLVYRHCLEVDDSGQSLLMGSTSGNLWSSADGGDSWSAISTNLADIYCVKFGH
ncbi:MAG: exo-alpha-sialidase [Pseudomonadales bacterium]|nr:exo-alpha-sialidase [Pseudomonadales bacterium]